MKNPYDSYLLRRDKPRFLGFYLGKPVYEGDENSAEFKLMVVEGKRIASSINAAEPSNKIHAVECIRAGLEYVDCEELKIRAALAIILFGWIALFCWMMF